MKPSLVIGALAITGIAIWVYQMRKKQPNSKNEGDVKFVNAGGGGGMHGGGGGGRHGGGGHHGSGGGHGGHGGAPTIIYGGYGYPYSYPYYQPDEICYYRNKKGKIKRYYCNDIL